MTIQASLTDLETTSKTRCGTPFSIRVRPVDPRWPGRDARTQPRGVDKVINPWLIALALSVAPSAEGAEFSLERFEFFNHCDPIRVVVSLDIDEKYDPDLKEGAVQALIESRLRSARIYSDSLRNAVLLVQVHIVGTAYSISVDFSKMVRDVASDTVALAGTWTSTTTGIHGGQEISSPLSSVIDRFLVEYLRANEAACEGR